MINIIIADHQAIFRAGIAKILAVEDDLRIVGQPKSLEQLVNCLEKLRSRVLVISSRFTSDLSTIQSLAQRSGIALMVLAESTESASAYMAQGVPGVVYRSVPGDSLVEAVRRLARGETYVQVANLGSGVLGEDGVGARVRDRLSDKEIKIMAAVVRGYKNREIALQHYTSEQVIKNALRNIFDKTGVSDRLELALFVLHHKILAQATAAVQIQPEQRRPKGPASGRSRSTDSTKRVPPTVH
jgi:DNA-binding NarL/FixJ family response regulator